MTKFDKILYIEIRNREDSQKSENPKEHVSAKCFRCIGKQENKTDYHAI